MRPHKVESEAVVLLVEVTCAVPRSLPLLQTTSTTSRAADDATREVLVVFNAEHGEVCGSANHRAYSSLQRTACLQVGLYGRLEDA